VVKTVHLYTDGSRIHIDGGGEGPGGYAALLMLDNGKEIEITGGSDWSTSSRMELAACIEGLRAIKEPCRVIWYTDCYDYVAIVESGVLPNKNQDLFARLYELAKPHDLSAKYVKAHDSDRFNNLVHRLAVREARRRYRKTRPIKMMV
jgi:ribonuclease HI